jgi:mono/diheme cytochrome c family protein
MKNHKSHRLLSCLFALASAASLFAAGACNSSGRHVASAKPSGSTLWGQNCGRCHNIRSPSDFSDAEWDVATLHMRVRANLTPEEYTSIRDFLKASN